MGESKRRQGYHNVMSNQARRHLPPPGMENASGSLVLGLARGAGDLIADAVSRGLEPNVGALTLLAVAVDYWRANYGDEHCLEAVTATARRRLEKPLEYWGARPQR